MIVAVDFDSTCVGYDYPRIGADIGALRVLKMLQGNNHRIVLSTMRSDRNGKPELTRAVEYLEKNGVKLWGINKTPTQHKWSSSPKVFCDLYIGVDAVGCPTKEDPEIADRPFVDWEKVEAILVEKGYLGFLS